MPNEHTSKQYDAELERIRSRVLQMGGLVENQIIRSIEALGSGDLDFIDTIIADDHRVNALEVAIDEDCSHVIARRQPAAGDLRMLTAIIKSITDLERIGDEAEKIARMAKLIYESDRLHMPRFTEVNYMGDIALDMLRKALDSFARADVVLATEVIRQDIQLDDEFRAIIRQLITYMMEDPRSISASLEILSAAKALERIGDHSKNMAEYVVYMVKGKDVRHIAVEEIERQIRE